VNLLLIDFGVQSIRMNDEKDSGKDRKGGFSMKKSKILIVGLIGLLMAGGFVFASCKKNTCDCREENETYGQVWCGDTSCKPGGCKKCES
jgi:hypothetical protein